MRDDVRRKLDRQLRWERVRGVLVVLPIVLAIAGLLALKLARQDAPAAIVEERDVPAVVMFSSANAAKSGMYRPFVRARLEDGTVVDPVLGAFRQIPAVGTHVVLHRVTRTASRPEYTWREQVAP